MDSHLSKSYAPLDHPLILPVLFHPRTAAHPPTASNTTSDHHIPVQGGCTIGARFYTAAPSGANILFFHGNGETVPDYNELGFVYSQIQINLLAVDYRGYGQSTGQPTVSAMMADCHAIYRYARQWLKDSGCNGPLIIMGRSLGSASALELAAVYAGEIDGLIIESGFAYTLPLLRLLGAELSAGMNEQMGFENLEKIKAYTGPTLLIHAEKDHIIPYSDGRALFEASGSTRKNLLKIQGANHNDLLVRGFNEYLQAVKHFSHFLIASA